MHNSVKGEYALQAILDLASRRAGEPIRIAEIAQRQEIPQKFLELILASLKQGGFVESRRGAEGGYLLARPAESLTVGEVLRYVEGPQLGKSRDGRKGEATPFSAMWEQVDGAISGVIDKTTFAGLLPAGGGERKKARPQPGDPGARPSTKMRRPTPPVGGGPGFFPPPTRGASRRR